MWDVKELSTAQGVQIKPGDSSDNIPSLRKLYIPHSSDKT